MILSMIYYNKMVEYEDPTISECTWSYRKRETYGLNLKLFKIDKVSEILAIPKWQDKNILQ